MHSPFAQPWQITVLAAVYAEWALLLFGGLIAGKRAPGGEHRMPTWTRMSSSAALVVAAWLQVPFTSDLPLGAYAVFIAVGMTCGLLGDLLLAGVIPFAQPVLGGIGAFAFGHIAYLFAVVGFSQSHSLQDPVRLWGTLALFLLTGLWGWFVAVYRGKLLDELRWPALIYSLLLASVAGLFCGLALQAPVFVTGAVGAILFLASDLILASQMFSGRTFPGIGDLIWLTYGPGQALIVVSVLSAVTVTR